jgi:hypothetical protein
MFVIGGKALERQIVELVDRIQTGYDSKLDKIKNYLDLSAEVDKLRETVSFLRIDKSRIEEEFAKERREIEHKVGLVKLRQIEELKLAKKEAVLNAREAALVESEKRFGEQLRFHDERFQEQVNYLKDMVGQVLKRLPSAEIYTEVKKGR